LLERGGRGINITASDIAPAIHPHAVAGGVAERNVAARVHGHCLRCGQRTKADCPGSIEIDCASGSQIAWSSPGKIARGRIQGDSAGRQQVIEADIIGQNRDGCCAAVAAEKRIAGGGGERDRPVARQIDSAQADVAAGDNIDIRSRTLSQRANVDTAGNGVGGLQSSTDIGDRGELPSAVDQGSIDAASHGNADIIGAG